MGLDTYFAQVPLWILMAFILLVTAAGGE